MSNDDKITYGGAPAEEAAEDVGSRDGADVGVGTLGTGAGASAMNSVTDAESGGPQDTDEASGDATGGLGSAVDTDAMTTNTTAGSGTGAGTTESNATGAGSGGVGGSIAAGSGGIGTGGSGTAGGAGAGTSNTSGS